MSLWISVAILFTAGLALISLQAVCLLGPWTRLRSSVRPWYVYRRPLTTLAFVLMTVQVALVATVQFQGDFFQAIRAVSPFFGFLACVFLGLLVLTRWNGWRDHISWNAWSVMHAVLLATLLLSIVVVQIEWSRIGGAPMWTTYALIGLLLFWTAIAPWAVTPYRRELRGNWQGLSILLHPAYVAFWLYAFFGPFAEFEMIRAVLVGCAVTVFGSYVIEWIHAFQEKRRSTAIEQFAPWYDAIALSRLTTRGMRVEVSGVSLACFIHEGKPIAFFGYCTREPNPLWLGFIHQGELHCPWHGCRFSVIDGSSTRGLQDRIPRFETKIVDDRVWIKIPRKLTA
jgi:nitrite reductase/ring-hydroxylating ferredoxin subunit